MGTLYEIDLASLALLYIFNLSELSQEQLPLLGIFVIWPAFSEYRSHTKRAL